MPEASQELRFGRVQVLPLQRQLLVGGTPVALGSRAFDVLMTLIDHRERVVTKNELLDLVWPGLVVEEGNLKTQVSSLRKCIGAEAIATIPARGYRFAALLEGDASSPVSSAFAPASGGVEMIGRDQDLAALNEQLWRHRLVTVLGAGGIGKTTLALAAARDVRKIGGRVAWVDLSPLADAAMLPVAVAQALPLALPDPSAPLPALIAALVARPPLLVIDNAEHLARELAPLLQALLAGCAALRVLVTSQAALKLQDEHLFRLGPLQTPPPGTPLDAARACGAVTLFAERAQAAQRDFTLEPGNLVAVIRLCRALDGLPLAIELAAGRLPLLGIDGLVARLDERFRLLAGNNRSAPTRQQTLLAALEWSHELLSAPEQVLFRKLGVFVGGFTLEGAVAVAREPEQDEWAVIDLLGSLVERSLVAADGVAGSTDAPRYRLLESTRAYALQKLDAAGQSAAVQRRHAQALSEQFDREELAMWTTPQTVWLARCAPELDNLRAALDWSSEHEPGLAIALAGASLHLFGGLSLMHESRQRSDRLEPLLATAAALPRDTARFLRVRSFQLRDDSVAMLHQRATRAARLCRDIGDEFGLHEALYLVVRAFTDYPADAKAALLEMRAVEQPGWPAARRALSLIAESIVAYLDGRMADNKAALEQALPLLKLAGTDRLTIVVLCNLADHELLVGNADEAVRRGEEVTALLRRGRVATQLAQALCNLANAYLQRGEAALARTALVEALEVMRIQQWSWLRGFGEVYALLAAQEQRFAAAAGLLGWADEVRRQRGAPQRNEARCREQAWQLIAAELAPQQRVLLMAEGAAMAPQQVCATLLEAAP